MEINAGDTAWVLAAAALVLIMTPGLGFFYGGLVSRQHAASTIMQCFIIVALISVQWVLWGYSLAFGPDLVGGLIGGLNWVGLNGVAFDTPHSILLPGAEKAVSYAPTIPHQAYMIFQAMFAIITPALIIGAITERIKFGSFLLFILLWATLVYDPVAHWVWSKGGWLGALGALDFAGGTVVHINSGVAALAAALVLRRSPAARGQAMEPHNVPFVVLGASLLWFGWFGFNAGSAVAAGGQATSAFVVTNTATGTAALTWMAMTWLFSGKPSIVGAASGAVAGLVAITPASGYVGPMAALIIGLGAGIFCYLAVRWRAGAKIDDSLDVWGVHGIGGTWGAFATGLFATEVISGIPGANGLFFGNPAQVGTQLVAIVATWVYSFVLTFIILKAIDVTLGLKVKEEEEALGLDISQHGEPAYTL